MSAPPPSPIALSHLLNHTADMVQGVGEGRSLTDLMARVPLAARAGTQALTFEVLRQLGGAQAVRSIVAAKPPPPAVDALLVSAIALLWPPDAGERAAYPDHTLVDQAVHAAHQRTPAAVAFVNAVLRRFVRERDALAAQARHQPVGAFNHPLWWIERIKHDTATYFFSCVNGFFHQIKCSLTFFSSQLGSPIHIFFRHPFKKGCYNCFRIICYLFVFTLAACN